MEPESIGKNRRIATRLTLAELVNGYDARLLLGMVPLRLVICCESLAVNRRLSQSELYLPEFFLLQLPAFLCDIPSFCCVCQLLDVHFKIVVEIGIGVGIVVLARFR